MNIVPGDIGLIMIGTCTYVDKVRLAEEANLSGVILYNPPSPTTLALPSSRVLLSPWFEGDFMVKIPVIGATNSLGELLKQYKGQVRLITNCITLTTTTRNVWCDTAGNETNTIVVGAHLDSVLAGPGINDNGSGSSGILEILRQLYAAGITPVNRLRFAWWGAEEEGLLGSRNYFRIFNQTNPAELAKIAAGLNLDMIGSPNYVPYVGCIQPSTNVPTSAVNGTHYITSLFRDFYQSIFSTATTAMVMGPSSDHWSFLENGIPAGRIHSGSSQIKSVKWQKIVGGISNVPADPCYHAYCDTYHNINPVGLENLSKALADVIYTVAMDPNIRSTLNNYNLPQACVPEVFSTQGEEVF
jgi:hypothetical protein